MKRIDGRLPEEVREIIFTENPFGNATSSIFYEQGDTKIFASVGLVQGVPKFLRNTGNAWLTAEYIMHPYACAEARSQRDNFPNPRDQRSIEISRFLGRCFRSVVDLNKLGEFTIFLDCDVMQADGSSRTACINALTLALTRAEKIWLSQKKIKHSFFNQPIFAVSVGVAQDDSVLIDLNKQEDNNCISDFNFVMSADGNLIEVQGTAEARPLPWNLFDQSKDLAFKSIKKLALDLGF